MLDTILFNTCPYKGSFGDFGDLLVIFFMSIFIYIYKPSLRPKHENILSKRKSCPNIQTLTEADTGIVL